MPKLFLGINDVDSQETCYDFMIHPIKGAKCSGIHQIVHFKREAVAMLISYEAIQKKASEANSSIYELHANARDS